MFASKRRAGTDISNSPVMFPSALCSKSSGGTVQPKLTKASNNSLTATPGIDQVKQNSLPPLPIDSQPERDEIQGILREYASRADAIQAFEGAAEMVWRARKLKANPDAFLHTTWRAAKAFKAQWPSYAHFTQSSHWATVKQQVFHRADHLCECCGRWATDVHIRDYRPRVPTGKDLIPLVAMCSACLLYVEKDPMSGEPREHEEQETALAIIYGQAELIEHIEQLLAGRVPAAFTGMFVELARQS